jgi:AraC-like DNA-binding protein
VTPRTSTAPRSKGRLTPEQPRRGEGRAGAGVGAEGAAEPPVRIERRFPAEAASAFVRHFWLPRWHLPAGAEARETVLEYPAANLVIEPDVALLHRASRGASVRTLSGDGWAFGALLRPGAARGWAGASLRALPAAVPVAKLGGTGVAEALTAAVPGVRAAMSAGDDDAAIAVFEAAVERLPPPDADARLVDAIVSAAEEDRDLRRVEQLAERFGIGVRTLQRLVAGHLGFGPKWLLQRYRLQEAAAALRSDAPPPLAVLAAELGYADQAHFNREFKAVVGATPGAYAAAVRR